MMGDVRYQGRGRRQADLAMNSYPVLGLASRLAGLKACIADCRTDGKAGRVSSRSASAGAGAAYRGLFKRFDRRVTGLLGGFEARLGLGTIR